MKPVLEKAINKTESQEYNLAAMEAYEESELIPCKVCDRRFTMGALNHHSIACRPNGYFDQHRPPTQAQIEKNHSDRAVRKFQKRIAPKLEPNVTKAQNKTCKSCRMEFRALNPKFCPDCGVKVPGK